MSLDAVDFNGMFSDDFCRVIIDVIETQVVLPSRNILLLQVHLRPEFDIFFRGFGSGNEPDDGAEEYY